MEDGSLCDFCLTNEDQKSMVVCNTCERASHIYCLEPMLFVIPKIWKCPRCVRKTSKTVRAFVAVHEEAPVSTKDDSPPDSSHRIQNAHNTAELNSHLKNRTDLRKERKTNRYIRKPRGSKKRLLIQHSSRYPPRCNPTIKKTKKKKYGVECNPTIKKVKSKKEDPSNIWKSGVNSKSHPTTRDVEAGNEDEFLRLALKNSIAFEKRCDISEIPQAPVFKPTERQFENPIEYISGLHQIGIKYGAVKIIPPESWKPEFNIDSKLFTFQARTQHIHKLQEGQGFAMGRSYTLSEFKKKAENYAGIMQRSGLNVHRVADVEKHYWKIVSGMSNPTTVEYGSDIPSSRVGSGFRLDEKSTWNLCRISRESSSPLSLLEDIDGVNVPWVYCGMLFSSFCWHCEDNYLPSINYLHKGCPKVWYCVASKDSTKLEKAMQANLPCLFEREPDLIHKLCTALDPSILMANGVKVNKIVQTEGTFVVTFPRGYHSGFNTGFNVAEAVNVAYDEWFPYGRQCSNVYATLRRPSVFSYVKLLSQWTQLHNSLPKTLELELEKVIREETKKIEKLQATHGYKVCDSFFNSSEDLLCSHCQTHLHLSYIFCKKCEIAAGDSVRCCIKHSNKVCKKHRRNINKAIRKSKVLHLLDKRTDARKMSNCN